MAQRGPYSKTAAKREEILSATLSIIATNGYSGATLQDVADAVGMSKPGVLHHFGTRDALFTAVLARRDEVDNAAFPTDDMINSLIATIRHNAEVPGLVALYAALTGIATSEPDGGESREFFSARYPVVIAALAEGIRRHQAAGDVAADADPVALARLLTAAADGLQTQFLLDPTVDMASELETLWALIRSRK